MPNPFRNWIVSDAWERPETDVGEIGRQAFEICREAIRTTIHEQNTTAVLVRGEPGSGKTHLMRRLRAHLESDSDPRLRDTLFVYIRLATTANMMWRYFRRRIAGDLLRPTAKGPSQLEWLVYRLLAAPGSHGALLERWKRELARGSVWDERAFANGLAALVTRIPERHLAGLNIFDRLEGDASLPPALVRALHRLLHRRDLGLVRAWLRGDSLTAENLTRLGIAEDTFAEEDPEYAAREMVLALARLAGARMPMVLCFDQVEALEIGTGDLSGFRAFGTAASLLHAETSNLVLISCAQSSLENMFRRADYDRIVERQATLQLLGHEDGMRLIQARLAAAGVEWTPPAEFESVFKWEGRASARAILAKAAELFDRAFDHTPAELPLDEFLRQEWDRRVSRAAEWLTEDNADEVLDQGIPVLLAITHPEWKPARGSRDVDVKLESQAGTLGVSLCNQRNMTSLAARFRRLGTGKSRGDNSGLVLVRDPRLSIGKSARVTRGRLDQLVRSGARLVHPSIEALQALEALRTLLADARAGDLTHNGERVPVRTLEQWMARHLPRSLENLTEELTGKTKEPAGYARIREDLLAMLEQRCVVTLEEAARETRHEPETMRRVARSSPDLAGFLEGPPAVLYRIVPANV